MAPKPKLSPPLPIPKSLGDGTATTTTTTTTTTLPLPQSLTPIYPQEQLTERTSRPIDPNKNKTRLGTVPMQKKKGGWNLIPTYLKSAGDMVINAGPGMVHYFGGAAVDIVQAFGDIGASVIGVDYQPGYGTTNQLVASVKGTGQLFYDVAKRGNSVNNFGTFSPYTVGSTEKQPFSTRGGYRYEEAIRNNQSILPYIVEDAGNVMLFGSVLKGTGKGLTTAGRAVAGESFAEASAAASRNAAARGLPGLSVVPENSAFRNLRNTVGEGIQTVGKGMTEAGTQWNAATKSMGLHKVVGLPFLPYSLGRKGVLNLYRNGIYVGGDSAYVAWGMRAAMRFQKKINDLRDQGVPVDDPVIVDLEAKKRRAGNRAMTQQLKKEQKEASRDRGAERGAVVRGLANEIENPLHKNVINPETGEVYGNLTQAEGQAVIAILNGTAQMINRLHKMFGDKLTPQMITLLGRYDLYPEFALTPEGANIAFSILNPDQSVIAQEVFDRVGYAIDNLGKAVVNNMTDRAIRGYGRRNPLPPEYLVPQPFVEKLGRNVQEALRKAEMDLYNAENSGKASPTDIAALTDRVVEMQNLLSAWDSIVELGITELPLNHPDRINALKSIVDMLPDELALDPSMYSAAQRIPLEFYRRFRAAMGRHIMGGTTTEGTGPDGGGPFTPRSGKSNAVDVELAKRKRTVVDIEKDIETVGEKIHKKEEQHVNIVEKIVRYDIVDEYIGGKTIEEIATERGVKREVISKIISSSPAANTFNRMQKISKSIREMQAAYDGVIDETELAYIQNQVDGLKAQVAALQAQYTTYKAEEAAARQIAEEQEDAISQELDDLDTSLENHEAEYELAGGVVDDLWNEDAPNIHPNELSKKLLENEEYSLGAFLEKGVEIKELSIADPETYQAINVRLKRHDSGDRYFVISSSAPTIGEATVFAKIEANYQENKFFKTIESLDEYIRLFNDVLKDRASINEDLIWTEYNLDGPGYEIGFDAPPEARYDEYWFLDPSITDQTISEMIVSITRLRDHIQKIATPKAKSKLSPPAAKPVTSKAQLKPPAQTDPVGPIKTAEEILTSIYEEVYDKLPATAKFDKDQVNKFVKFVVSENTVKAPGTNTTPIKISTELGVYYDKDPKTKTHTKPPKDNGNTYLEIIAEFDSPNVFNNKDKTISVILGEDSVYENIESALEKLQQAREILQGDPEFYDELRTEFYDGYVSFPYYIGDMKIDDVELFLRAVDAIENEIRSLAGLPKMALSVSPRRDGPIIVPDIRKSLIKTIDRLNGQKVGTAEIYNGTGSSAGERAGVTARTGKKSNDYIEVSFNKVFGNLTRDEFIQAVELAKQRVSLSYKTAASGGFGAANGGPLFLSTRESGVFGNYWVDKSSAKFDKLNIQDVLDGMDILRDEILKEYDSQVAQYGEPSPSLSQVPAEPTPAKPALSPVPVESAPSTFKNQRADYVIIPCGAAKGPVAAPIEELYTGSMFKDALATARQMFTDDRIFVLSAKHGLMPLGTVVEPYEQQINKPGAIQWNDVSVQLKDLGIQRSSVLSLLPQNYHALLVRSTRGPGEFPIDRHQLTIEQAFEGTKGIGEQKSVLKKLREEQLAAEQAPPTEPLTSLRPKAKTPAEVEVDTKIKNEAVQRAAYYADLADAAAAEASALLNSAQTLTDRLAYLERYFEESAKYDLEVNKLAIQLEVAQRARDKKAKIENDLEELRLKQVELSDSLGLAKDSVESILSHPYYEGYQNMKGNVPLDVAMGGNFPTDIGGYSLNDLEGNNVALSGPMYVPSGGPKQFFGGVEKSVTEEGFTGWRDLKSEHYRDGDRHVIFSVEQVAIRMGEEVSIMVENERYRFIIATYGETASTILGDEFTQQLYERAVQWADNLTLDALEATYKDEWEKARKDPDFVEGIGAEAPGIPNPVQAREFAIRLQYGKLIAESMQKIGYSPIDPYKNINALFPARDVNAKRLVPIDESIDLADFDPAELEPPRENIVPETMFLPTGMREVMMQVVVPKKNATLTKLLKGSAAVTSAMKTTTLVFSIPWQLGDIITSMQIAKGAGIPFSEFVVQMKNVVEQEYGSLSSGRQILETAKRFAIPEISPESNMPQRLKNILTPEPMDIGPLGRIAIESPVQDLGQTAQERSVIYGETLEPKKRLTNRIADATGIEPIGKIGDTNKAIVGFSFNLNASINKLMRHAFLFAKLAEELKKRGMTLEQLNNDTAAEWKNDPEVRQMVFDSAASANEWLGDYANLNMKERMYYSQAFPFYSWMRHIHHVFNLLIDTNPEFLNYYLYIGALYMNSTEDPMNLRRGSASAFGGVSSTNFINPFADVVGGPLFSLVLDKNIKPLGQAIGPVPRLVTGAAGWDITKMRPLSRPAGTGSYDEAGNMTYGGPIFNPGETLGFTLQQFPLATRIMNINPTPFENIPGTRIALGPVSRYSTGEARINPVTGQRLESPGGRLAATARLFGTPFVPFRTDEQLDQVMLSARGRLMTLEELLRRREISGAP